MKKIIASLATAMAVTSFSVTTHAAPVLLGIGSLTGNTDKSGLTNTLEDGSSAAILGGLGSGLAYAGNNTFLALPDRGPNAMPYNGGSSVDNTTSYIARFHTISMNLTANAYGLPFSITPTLNSTTLLYNNTALNYGADGAPAQNSANHYFFTGKSDGFDAGSSTNPANARLDPESIRVSNDGKSIFISDEYGPYVYQFDRASGLRTKTFTPPTNLAVSNLSATGNTEISGNTTGRTANKGMEGLAITPDGSTLVGIMQAPLLQDTNKIVRIVTIDIASGTTHEYAYQLTTDSDVSEIVALNNHEFLVDERDGKGLGDNSNAVIKQVFKIDLNGAQDVSNLSGDLASKAVNKNLVLDVKAMLIDAGVAAKDIPAKIEGMAFGDDVSFNGSTLHTLWIANDNDFLNSITDNKHPNGFANPNNFYVFGFSDTDLENYTPQHVDAFVAEPSRLALLGIGFVVLATIRRTKAQ